KNLVRASNHPLSRRLYNALPSTQIVAPKEFKEWVGKGIEGRVYENHYRLGSAQWIAPNEEQKPHESAVYIMKNEEVVGKYIFQNHYRPYLNILFETLQKENIEMHIVSGDNDGEKRLLEREYPQISHYIFNQKAIDKLEYIQSLQNQSKTVLMVGDGLNDAGALAQSNVGISVSENIN